MYMKPKEKRFCRKYKFWSDLNSDIWLYDMDHIQACVYFYDFDKHKFDISGTWYLHFGFIIKMIEY